MEHHFPLPHFLPKMDMVALQEGTLEVLRAWEWRRYDMPRLDAEVVVTCQPWSIPTPTEKPRMVTGQRPLLPGYLDGNLKLAGIAGC